MLELFARGAREAIVVHRDGHFTVHGYDKRESIAGGSKGRKSSTARQKTPPDPLGAIDADVIGSLSRSSIYDENGK